MKYPQKSDANEFKRIIEELEKNPTIERAKDWCRYLYHNTALQNAVSILEHELILSRRSIKTQKISFRDIADSDVLQTTAPLAGYVRLYFRPKTPTAYHTEGVKPQHLLQKNNVHSPIPVFFLFDAVSLLGMKGTSFTSEHYSRNHMLLTTSKQFQSLSFDAIYSDYGWGDSTSQNAVNIKKKRHAEVLVPQELGLDNLKKIVVRSHAEYETLQYLVPNNVFAKWQTKIEIDDEGKVFHHKWLFLTKVYLGFDSIKLTFNIPAYKKDRGPFQVKIKIIEIDQTKASDNRTFDWQDDNWFISDDKPSLLAELSLDPPLYDYKMEVLIDGEMVYINEYHLIENIPF